LELRADLHSRLFENRRPGIIQSDIYPGKFVMPDLMRCSGLSWIPAPAPDSDPVGARNDNLRNNGNGWRS
jgi:hypothetical protein